MYPGIDMLFHGNQQRLEYDFEAGPGSDVSAIRIAFERADEVRIAADGTLVVRAGGFEIRQPPPLAYQIRDGQKSPVPAAYKLTGAKRVRFEIGPYDHLKTLVIDPQLLFDNLFGGSGMSSAADIALDSSGNIYVAGQTDSAGFPVQNAAQKQAGAQTLLESADGGQTWTTPAVNGQIVRSIASGANTGQAPSGSSTLYASIVSGVIRSTDGGTTWTTPANAGLTAAIIGVAVDAGSPSTVYAATQDQGVFVSTDGGASWTQSANGMLVANSTPPYPELSGIFANPAVPGNVFAVASSPDFVYESANAGQSWTQVDIPAGGSPQTVVFGPPMAAADSPAAVEQTILIGQFSGGLFESAGPGGAWNNIASPESLLGTQSLAMQPGDPAVLLGAGVNAVSRSTDGGMTWTTVLAQPSASVAFDPKNPSTAYALSSAGLYRSGDGGQTWAQTPLPYTRSFNTLFVSAFDSRILVGEGTQTDAFVTKYSADGSMILYSTYLGGSGNDMATGIAVDASGSAYVIGETQSSNFPATSAAVQTAQTITNAAFSQNAFVAKLSADGSQLVYSTYLGGGAENTGRIAVDSAGEAVVIGSTASKNFPVTQGAYQTALNTNCTPQPLAAVPGSEAAFIAKLSATGGSLIFSTLLGGTCATYGQTVALDESGSIWAGGSTTSPDFAVTQDALQPVSAGGIYDGFLARFTPAGSLSYASYVGGTGYDTVSGIAFDRTGNLYLTGTTAGLSQAPSPGAFQTKAGTSCYVLNIGPTVYEFLGSAFVLKLDGAAHTNLGLTYLGYPDCLFPAAIAVDPSGQAWIGGTFSFAGSSPQTASPLRIGGGSGFLSKFSADFTQLLFSTYFDAVNGLALDSKGFAYAAGGGPLNGPLDTQQAFVAKIDATPTSVELDSVQNAVNAASPNNIQGIGPGEYLRLLGKNMGPAAAVMGIIKNGVVAAADAGVTVTFDGVAVPLLMVSAAEIDLMAPFELAQKTSTVVQVQYQGASSNPAQVVVSGTPLQVLGVFNNDFTPNSAANPAQAGSIMSLYVAGAGQTNPASVDGQVNGFPLLSAPAPVTIVYNGDDPPRTDVPVTVTFAGSVPGLAAGIFQINFVAPQPGMTALNLTVGSAYAGFNAFVQ